MGKRWCQWYDGNETGIKDESPDYWMEVAELYSHESLLMVPNILISA